MRRQGVGAGEAKGEGGGSSRSGQDELRQRQQLPYPTDLIYAACPKSATGGQVLQSERALEDWRGGLG